jgi:hypothetical protein
MQNRSVVQPLVKLLHREPEPAGVVESSSDALLQQHKDEFCED